MPVVRHEPPVRAPAQPRGTSVSNRNARADYELLKASRDDPAAFRAFYDQWSRSVLGFFQRRLRDPDTSLDLTAETFAIAFEQRARFRWIGKSPGAWLFGIARRLLYRHLRSQDVHMRALQRMGVEVPSNDDESIRRIEELMDNEGMRRMARVALESCKESDRVILELHFIDSMPYPELASFLGCTINAARVRVHRALARVERQITELEQRDELLNTGMGI